MALDRGTIRDPLANSICYSYLKVYRKENYFYCMYMDSVHPLHIKTTSELRQLTYWTNRSVVQSSTDATDRIRFIVSVVLLTTIVHSKQCSQTARCCRLHFTR